MKVAIPSFLFFGGGGGGVGCEGVGGGGGVRQSRNLAWGKLHLL